MQNFQDVVTSPHRVVSESVSLIRQTLESAAVAKLKYPDYRFTRLVLSRLDWDDADVAVLGALCDTDLSGPVELRPRLFDQQLRLVIYVWGLDDLFRKDGAGTYHHAIRSRGYDFDADEVIATEMERWRADYRAMKPVQQMLAASVVWLYRGINDNRWMRRIPCTWHATDAVHTLRDEGALRDWARLLALYPGW